MHCSCGLRHQSFPFSAVQALSAKVILSARAMRGLGIKLTGLSVLFCLLQALLCTLSTWLATSGQVECAPLSIELQSLKFQSFCLNLVGLLQVGTHTPCSNEQYCQLQLRPSSDAAVLIKRAWRALAQQEWYHWLILCLWQTVIKARLSKNGSPLVVLSNCTASLYHLGMKTWMRVADSGFPSSAFASILPSATTGCSNHN